MAARFDFEFIMVENGCHLFTTSNGVQKIFSVFETMMKLFFAIFETLERL